MKISKLLLVLILFSVKMFSQSDYILGSIANESGDKLPRASIYNLRTDQIVISDKMGNFAIAAKPSDELRISREGYERKVVVISVENFSKNLEVRLITVPQEIEEVKLTFRPTGILKKDVTRLNPPPKVVELNTAMNLYMKTPPSEPVPKASAPSAFKQPDLSAGQVSLLSMGSGTGGIVNAISGLVNKVGESPKTTADYTETQDFYRRIKSVIDLGFYTKYGMDEYDFDVFLAYADQAYNLAKNYRKNFNKVAIELKLKEAFAEYIKTHNFSKKQSVG